MQKKQKFFPNAKLRCALFAKEDTALILDRQEYEGDLFFLIEKAQEYILKNIHIGMKIEGLYRRDIPEINKEALREAIINAFCHRDYYEYDSVNIAVFKDRVEVRNPGLLYGGLTIKKITKEMVSERRNELIAQMLHRIHYIEKWGRGIKLILSREPQTKFKEVGKQFIVVFKRKEEFEDKKFIKKSSQKSSQKILNIIKENSLITIAELSSVLNISDRAVKKNINKLKQAGALKRIGPDKGGHWEAR